MSKKRFSVFLLSVLLAFSSLNILTYGTGFVAYAAEESTGLKSDGSDPVENGDAGPEANIEDNSDAGLEPDIEDTTDPGPEDPNIGTTDPGPVPHNCDIEGHTWNAGTVEKSATCTEAGRINYTCTSCGESRTEQIAPTGHNSKVVDEPPTICGTYGKRTCSCTNCGEVLYTEDIKPSSMEHDFGAWTVVKKATTRVDGVKQHKCKICGYVESQKIAHTILKVKSVKLSKAAMTIYKGKTRQLTATVAPDNATSTAVTWKSSDTKVATVSSTGKVTAKGKGTAIITCKAKDGSGQKATCKVTVKVRVTKLTLNKKALTLRKGKTYTLKVTIAPKNANNKKVTWKSSNTKVAAVSGTGIVTAKGKGTATITCTAKDGSGKKATCKVTVKIPVTSIKLNKTTATITKGRTMTLKATVSPSNASNKKVRWTSSNTSVATVSSTGKVTAKSKGTATITCKAKDGSGKKATCKITVKNPVVVSNNDTDTGSGITRTNTGTSGGGDVWISATGSKYHSKNNCGQMNPDKATRMTKEQAESLGYTPCSRCY